MSLNVNIRQLESASMHFRGVLECADIDWGFEDEVLHPGPVAFDLEAQRLDSDLLVQGSLGIDVECECVRCLKKFNHRLELPGWACHIPLEGEDRAHIANDCVDLTPYIREDILLELPQHPLCQTECPGLLKKPPASSGQMEGTGRSDRTSPAWSELNKLKFEQ